jgi:hypothetical protein
VVILTRSYSVENRIKHYTYNASYISNLHFAVNVTTLSSLLFDKFSNSLFTSQDDDKGTTH